MTLTKFPPDPLLDLDPWVGQRQASFRFHLIDGVTGENKGDITPLRGASLVHDTSRTIKRQLSMNFGVRDTAFVNTVRDRVLLFMVFPDGTEYPLGRYMFTDSSRQIFTSGKLGNVMLNDEMFLVDQQITTGVDARFVGVDVAINRTLADLPITFRTESTSYQSVESWNIGTGRGQILQSLSLSGDYFSPWFDNTGVLRFIRSFDPGTLGIIPDFDFDAGNKVMRNSIVETDDLLTAPNVFIVISNSATDTTTAAVGTAKVAATAPHSVENRGFEVPQVEDLQVPDVEAAQAVANNLVNRQTVFERVAINTAPDPRHDSYNVIKWQDDLWLELAWSMALTEGGQMGHLLRKAYKP
jgi:hypothetical protein